MNCGLLRHPLPALHGRIDVSRIELDCVTAPSRPFGSKNGRATAAEGIENDVAALRNVEDCIADHRDGLDGRMQVEAAPSAAACKGIVPDVRSVAPMLLELAVVDACCVSFTKDEHKFVPRAIERSRAAVGLDPYAEVQDDVAERSDRADDLEEVPPAHARKEGRPFDRMGDDQAEGFNEELAELVFGTFFDSHRNFTVFRRAFAAHMVFHPDTVGGIGENGDGFLSGEERVIRLADPVRSRRGGGGRPGPTGRRGGIPADLA